MTNTAKRLDYQPIPDQTNSKPGLTVYDGNSPETDSWQGSPRWSAKRYTEQECQEFAAKLRREMTDTDSRRRSIIERYTDPKLLRRTGWESPETD